MISFIVMYPIFSGWAAFALLILFFEIWTSKKARRLLICLAILSPFVPVIVLRLTCYLIMIACDRFVQSFKISRIAVEYIVTTYGGENV